MLEIQAVTPSYRVFKVKKYTKMNTVRLTNPLEII